MTFLPHPLQTINQPTLVDLLSQLGKFVLDQSVQLLLYALLLMQLQLKRSWLVVDVWSTSSFHLELREPVGVL